MTEEKTQQEKPILAPPEDPIDPERVAVAQERWEVCPLRECKENAALLYEDFHLRDIRSNRVMCSKCAVHTEIGYMSREAAGYEPDKPYDGKHIDYLLVFLTTAIMSVGINSLLVVYLNYTVLAFFLGIAFGLLIGQAARRLTHERVGRFSGLVAAIGVIVGMIIAPIYFFLFGSFFSVITSGAFSLDMLSGLAPIIPGFVATGLMAFTTFLVFLKR